MNVIVYPLTVQVPVSVTAASFFAVQVVPVKVKSLLNISFNLYPAETKFVSFHHDYHAAVAPALNSSNVAASTLKSPNYGYDYKVIPIGYEYVSTN